MARALAGKRVLFVLDCLELGGAERQALLLAAHLKEEEGARVSLLGLSSTPGRICELCDAAGIEWSGIDCNLAGTRSGFLKSLAAALKSIRSLKPDLILPYTWRPNVVCGLVWRLSSARGCVWNQRDEGIGLERGLRFRMAVGLTPFFISNSSGGKEFLMRSYGLRESQVRLIPNGVVLSGVAKSRREWRGALGVGEDCFLACMAANLHFFKDHGTLVRAWRKVLDSVGPTVEAVLVLPGRFSVAEQELRGVIAELGLEERVRLLGKVDDIAGLLAAADLYLHSSHTEGVPNAILEAMAAGLPVIATDIPGNRGALGPEGEHGLVPVRDPAAMSVKIVEFMSDRDLRARTGRVLKERVERVFPLSSMLGSTVQLLEEVAG